MPRKYITYKEEVYSTEGLLEHLRSRPEGEFPVEVARAIIEASGDRDYISTTSLTATCKRSGALKSQVGYTESLEGLWAAFRGTAMHSTLEAAGRLVGGVIVEPRFHVDLAGVLGRKKKAPFSGSPDTVDIEYGILGDYKFTREGKAPRWGGPWPNHREQAQLNRWLCDHADSVTLPGGEVADPKDIRPPDWQALQVIYMDDRGITPLTVTKSVQVPKKDGNGTKAKRVVDIWSDEKVEDFIRIHYPIVEKGQTSNPLPMMPEGWDHQSGPLCAFCPVRAACSEAEKEGV